MSLSILCVTLAERHAAVFLAKMQVLALSLQAECVFVADGLLAELTLRRWGFPCAGVDKTGPSSLEAVLDMAISHCHGQYILRLDDDETCSTNMQKWLHNKEYEAFDHWDFPRVYFWGDTQTVIFTRELWPDYQTRLSIPEKSGGRTNIHAGSPYGYREIAPVVIEHHKFLVKSYQERQAIVARYDAHQQGFGSGHFLPYTLPEDAYESLNLIPYIEMHV